MSETLASGAATDLKGREGAPGKELEMGVWIVEWRGIQALGRLGGQDIIYLPTLRTAHPRTNFLAQNNDGASIETPEPCWENICGRGTASNISPVNRSKR